MPTVAPRVNKPNGDREVPPYRGTSVKEFAGRQARLSELSKGQRLYVVFDRSKEKRGLIPDRIRSHLRSANRIGSRQIKLFVRARRSTRNIRMKNEKEIKTKYERERERERERGGVREGKKWKKKKKK